MTPFKRWKDEWLREKQLYKSNIFRIRYNHTFYIHYKWTPDDELGNQQ